VTADAALLLACRRHPAAAEVSRGLDRAGVPVGAPVIVAASGGVDSTALLALAAGCAAHGRIAVTALHVDHGLRAESRAEGDAVAALASRLGLACLRRAPTIAPGAGLADRARTARYAALADAAREAGAGFVLTAHHADDQLETIVLALARGAGLHGLGGMPTRRALEPGIDLVRPCLRMPRADLRGACIDLGLHWDEDPGNARVDTPRGRARHLVLPAIESIAPDAARRAARTAELARLGDVLLAQHADALGAEQGSVPRAALRGSPAALAASVVHRMAGEAIDASGLWQAADAAIDSSTEPRRFPLTDGRTLVVDAHAVRVVPAQGSVPEPGRQRS
jgi:tRNA(Ile)-lysidine synthase